MNPILIAAIPIVIHGNGYGLWSPNASVATMPVLPPRSRAYDNSHRHAPPPVNDKVFDVSSFDVSPDVCPTLQSRPQLCQ